MKVVIFATFIVMMLTADLALGDDCAFKVFSDAESFVANYMKECLAALPADAEGATEDDFDSIDADESGFIESTEWAPGQNGGYNLMLNERDGNGDGKISSDEFIGVDLFDVHPANV